MSINEKYLENLKGIKLYHKGRTYIIRRCVHYAGQKTVEVTIYAGFGLNEDIISLSIPDKDFQQWINDVKVFDQNRNLNLTIQKPIVKMEEEKEEKNNFSEMRSILFDTLRGVKDGSISPDKAKAVSQTAQTIINTVKTELDFLKLTNNPTQPKVLK